MLRNCLTCSKEFKTIPAKIKAGKGKYCSRKCYLVEHMKNTWTTGFCLGCEKKFKYQTKRKQTCCSLSCNSAWKKKKNKTKKYSIKKCLQCYKGMEVLKSKEKEERGKYCSRKCWAKWMSKNRIGKNAYSWKGGITPLYRRIRTLAKYYKWRKKVLRRDNFQCVECKEKNIEKLIVDHIVGMAGIMKNNKVTNSIEANKCEELWDTANGRVLCKKCHAQTENYGVNGWIN